MKYARPILLLAAALALVGCAAMSPEQSARLSEVVRLAVQDGVVDPGEVAAITAQLPAPGFDWMQALEVVGSIGASILGVKLLPDRHLRSPFDQPSPKQA